MKLRFLLLLLGIVVATTAAEPQSGLEAVAAFLRKNTSSPSAPVAVTATLKSQGNEHFLAFRLTNISGQRIQLRTTSFPWSFYSSTDVMAVSTSGKILARIVPGSSLTPGLPMISIAPGETMTGDYELSGYHVVDPNDLKRPPNEVFTVQMGFPKDDDIIIAWSYTFRYAANPPKAGEPLPIATGFVLIPKLK